MTPPNTYDMTLFTIGNAKRNHLNEDMHFYNTIMTVKLCKNVMVLR